MCKRIPDPTQITLDGQLNKARWLDVTDWCNDGTYIRSDVAGRVYTKNEATMIVRGIASSTVKGDLENVQNNYSVDVMHLDSNSSSTLAAARHYGSLRE